MKLTHGTCFVQALVLPVQVALPQFSLLFVFWHGKQGRLPTFRPLVPCLAPRGKAVALPFPLRHFCSNFKNPNNTHAHREELLTRRGSRCRRRRHCQPTRLQRRRQHPSLSTLTASLLCVARAAPEHTTQMDGTSRTSKRAAAHTGAGGHGGAADDDNRKVRRQAGQARSARCSNIAKCDCTNPPCSVIVPI